MLRRWGLRAWPDHSTISRTRRLIDVETHRDVTWALGVIAEKGLLKGKTVGIDATTLEANAALRSIVRRDSGESYQEFLTKLAKESGIETPTREDLGRLDRKRKKKASNKDLQEIGVRSYLPEPKREKRHPQGKASQQAAVYGNRRGIRGERGKQLLRRRGELVERSFAHIYDTGGMRRTHLRGHRNILKRLLIQVAAFNPNLILRREIGIGTPRSLRGRTNRVFFFFWTVWMVLKGLRERPIRQQATSAGSFWFLTPARLNSEHCLKNAASTTDC